MPALHSFVICVTSYVITQYWLDIIEYEMFLTSQEQEKTNKYIIINNTIVVISMMM